MSNKSKGIAEILITRVIDEPNATGSTYNLWNHFFQIIASLLTGLIWSVNILINYVPFMEMQEKLWAALPTRTCSTASSTQPMLLSELHLNALIVELQGNDRKVDVL